MGVMWGSVEGGEEVDTAPRLKRKHSLPIAVTTPKRGPLLLTSSEARGDGGSGRVRGRGGGERMGRIVGCGRQRMLQLPKKPAKHSLTRFPVAMVQRPLQEIEDDLGHLSCAVLQDTVHSVLVSHHYCVHTSCISDTHSDGITAHTVCNVHSR